MASRKPLKQLKALETDELDAKIMAKTMTDATGSKTSQRDVEESADSGKPREKEPVAAVALPERLPQKPKHYQQVRVTLPNTNKFTATLLATTEKVAEQSLTPEEVTHTTVFSAFLKRHEKELSAMLAKMVER